MIEIAEVQISLYLNMMALATMLGFMIISKRLRQRKDDGDKLFFGLCVNVVLFALSSVAVILIPTQSIDGYRIRLLIFQTVNELLVLFIIYQWLLFVGYTIYQSSDHLKRKYWPFFFPIAGLAVLLIINLFTGILFSYDENAMPQREVLYNLLIAVELFYFVLSGVLIWRHNRKADRMDRFHFGPILIPFAAGLFEIFISGIDIGPIAYTVGIIFIFFSMTERWQYDDEISGFYHKAILEYLTEQEHSGQGEYMSAVVFHTAGNEETLASLIRTELPRNGKAVHLGKGVFAAFLGRGKTDLKDLIVLAVTEAAEEYDQAHPEAPVAAEITVIDRKEDQGIEEFLSCVA